MIILALELSSPRGSLALLRGADLAGAAQWDEPQARHSTCFPILRDLLHENAVRPSDIDMIAVGRGPGSFSGMRLALTAASALALPHGKPIHAVSSGEALAFRIAEGRASCEVAVVGDARRGKVWCGLFGWDGRQMAPIQPWQLLAPEALDLTLPGDCVKVSPHWSRLRELGAVREGHGWIGRDEFPDARHVATLAAGRLAAGVPSEPLEPLYMHPPV